MRSLRLALAPVLLALMALFLQPEVASGSSLLLDNGVKPGGDGFVISGSNQSSGGFTLFQPFSVTDSAWEIETIGLYGFEATPLSDGTGFLGSLVPDLDGRPDETSAIASATYFLDQWPDGGPSWMYEPFDITLSEGLYWFVLASSSPDSFSVVSHGMSGEDVFSRRGQDGAEFSHESSAFQIVGAPIPEPAGAVLFLIGSSVIALAIGRRRRTAA